MPFRGGGDGDKPVGMQSISTLEELSNNPDSAVTKRSARIHLGLSPGTLSNIKQGLEAQLLPQINRYYPALGAILLGWDNLKLSVSTGLLIADTPSVHVDVNGDFFVFSPEIGSILPGVVNKRSERHVGCLVHNTFNISLMSEKIDPNVKQGDQLKIKVTKIMWGHKSLPIIQGVQVGDCENCDKPQEIGDEPDYDSGIDSTVNGVVNDNLEKEHDHLIEEDISKREKKSKKAKKRKAEVELDNDIAPSDSVDSSINLENTSVSKKKKKKKDKQ